MQPRQTRRCPTCGAEFETRKPFEAHYHAVHHRTSRLACPGCGAEFETRGQLVDHTRKLRHTW